MTPNLIPTEMEIEQQATDLFPQNKKLQSSYIMGVWHTIYNMKMPKDNEGCTMP